jgi:hypothetical protein
MRRLSVCVCAAGLVFFTDVRYLVLDEADTLFGSDFAAAIDKIVTPIRVRLLPCLRSRCCCCRSLPRVRPQNNPRQTLQTVCVSATLPADKLKIMKALFPVRSNFSLCRLLTGLGLLCTESAGGACARVARKPGQRRAGVCACRRHRQVWCAGLA